MCLLRANGSKLPLPANSFKKSAAADHVQAWYGAGCVRDGAFFSFECPDRLVYCRESWVVYEMAIG
jgi:hypothetical protein